MHTKFRRRLRPPFASGFGACGAKDIVWENEIIKMKIIIKKLREMCQNKFRFMYQIKFRLTPFGPTRVSLGAPGTAIHSTLYSDGYGLLTGTSMSAPLVA